MRIAFVQGGVGLEAVEQQAARLSRFSPDRYQIEANPTAGARQRLIELLDGLRAGDELCLASLDPLHLDVGDAAQLLLNLADRGARLLLAREDGCDLEIQRSTSTYRMLETLAAMHRRRKQAPPPKTPAAVHDVLTDAEVEDIRRLAGAGMSPRRIGLIYRRSPKCISELLCEAGEPAVTPAEQRRA